MLCVDGSDTTVHVYVYVHQGSSVQMSKISPWCRTMYIGFKKKSPYRFSV